jgi:hypothetical protein
MARYSSSLNCNIKINNAKYFCADAGSVRKGEGYYDNSESVEMCGRCQTNRGNI